MMNILFAERLSCVIHTLKLCVFLKIKIDIFYISDKMFLLKSWMFLSLNFTTI